MTAAPTPAPIVASEAAAPAEVDDEALAELLLEEEEEEEEAEEAAEPVEDAADDTAAVDEVAAAVDAPDEEVPDEAEADAEVVAAVPEEVVEPEAAAEVAEEAALAVPVDEQAAAVGKSVTPAPAHSSSAYWRVVSWSAESHASATQQEIEVMKEEVLQMHSTFRLHELGMALSAQVWAHVGRPLSWAAALMLHAARTAIKADLVCMMIMMCTKSSMLRTARGEFE